MNEVKIDREHCKQCEYCVKFCPKNVLEIGESINKSGYYPPVFARPEDCIGCGICAKMCPDTVLSVYKDVG